MGFYRCIRDNFAIVDLFQAPIIIKFEKREKTSTYFGVFFSIAIIIFLSIYFSNSDIFKKQSPKIVNIDVANVNRPKINYSNKLFAISVTDELSVAYTDYSIFTVEVINRYLQADPSGGFVLKNVTKTLHNCTPSDFSNNWYETLGLQGSFCLDQSFFETSGFWDENQVVLLEVNILMCDNQTSNITCKSTAEIQKYLDGKIFNIYYEGVNVDPTNYTSPMNPITYNDYYSMDYTIRKKVNIFLKNINLQTDDGWVWSDIHVLGGILYDSKETDLLITSKNLLFQCNLYSSRNSQSLQREYQKLFDALSDLGGIANIAMMFGFFITSIENSFTLRKKVMNSLYSFQDIGKYKEKVESRKNSKSEGNILDNSGKVFKLDEIPTSFKISKSENAENTFKSKREKKATFNEDPGILKFENLENSERENNNIRSETSIAKQATTYKKQDMISIHEPSKAKGILNKPRTVDENINQNLFEDSFRKDREKVEMLKNPSMSPSMVGTFNHIPEEEIRNYYDANSPNSPNENGKSFSHIPIPSFSKINIRPISSKKILVKGKSNKIDKKLKNLEQYNEFLRTSSSRLNMNFFEYIGLYFKQIIKMNLSEKERLFLKGSKIYDDELDIVYLLRKIQEIEKMKMVLFNEDQRTLFNMIDKPMIYLDGNNQYSSQDSSQLKLSRIATVVDENKMKKIFERMISMQKNDEMTIIDKRLMDLVEKKLTEFMQNF